MNGIKILFAIVLLSSCTSEYTKIFRSNDKALMLKSGIEYAEKKKYNKAIELLERVKPMFLGTPQAERVTYYLADTYFQDERYIQAAYEYENFFRSYKKSSKASEALFNKAFSFYKQSPVYERDQKFSGEAITAFQQYINVYGDEEIEKSEEAAAYISELRSKLEQKQLEIGKKYYDHYQYKAATVTLTNTLSDYPDSKNREEAHYYMVKSTYEYAMNAFEVTKKQRLIEARTAYRRMLKEFPETKHLKEINKIERAISEELAKFAS